MLLIGELTVIPFSLFPTGCTLAFFLAPSFFGVSAQQVFAPVELAPKIVPSGECREAQSSDISDAMDMVVQLMKSSGFTSSLRSSCTEIKESSPVSPSGYYTISNGNGGSAVVCCNMDELNSCPSLEQTLQELSSGFTKFTDTLTAALNTPVRHTCTCMYMYSSKLCNHIFGVSMYM